MPLSDKRFDRYNLHKMIIKPLYLGVLLNIILPGAMLFVCYYLNNNNSYTNAIVDFENANILFIVVAVLAIINSGIALWNWYENVDEGTDYLTLNYDEGYTYMQVQRQTAIDQVGFMASSVPREVLGEVAFDDNDVNAHRIEDCVGMKRYNGAGNGQYCSWNSQSKQWDFTRLNNLSFNYAERVCLTYP